MPVKNKKKTRKPNYSQDPILYDHFGNPLEEVLKRDKETMEKKKEELAQVAALVSESRGEAGGLLSKNFLIVSCNIFLKTDSTQAVVLPAEVSPLLNLVLERCYSSSSSPGGHCKVLIGGRR